MPMITLKLEGDGAWPDLAERPQDVIHTESIELAALANGMESGAPSVAMRFDTPDGKIVVAETSLACFLAAADALRARFYGN